MNKRFDCLLSLLSPHICKGCNALGSTLCKCCIINMLRQKYPICLICKRLCKNNNLCVTCQGKSSQPFNDIIAVGPRHGALKRLIGDYKYNSEIASAGVIADLLYGRLAQYSSNGSNFTLVPIPTIDKHIRERGFDHMLEVARCLSRLQNLPLNNKILGRTNNLSQHSLSRDDRRILIGRSIILEQTSNLPNNIVLLDDIWTTGSTLLTTAEKLKKADVRRIVGLVVAFQPNSE